MSPATLVQCNDIKIIRAGYHEKYYHGIKFFNVCYQGNIRKTCLCDEYPLKPHFYIEKTGVCRSIPINLIFDPKHRLWVLVRTALPRRF